VPLSDYDKGLIARRAGGEYGMNAILHRILLDNRKNREPDEADYLDFLRLVTKKSWDWGEYEALQRKILDRHPYPFGRPKEERPAEPIKQNRIYKCRICGEGGHNARSCPKKDGKTVIKYDDGFPRLAPGVDPSAMTDLQVEREPEKP